MNQYKNHENHENITNQYENHENYENQRNSCDSYENHFFFKEMHVMIKKIVKS